MNSIFKTLYKFSTNLRYQMEACGRFYGKQMPKFKGSYLTENETLEFMKKNQLTYSAGSPVCNMTGLDAHNIISGLYDIVNDEARFAKGKQIYLYFQLGDPEAKYEEVFKLNANPTKDQPGNAVVFILPRGFKVIEKAKSYKELNNALKKHYDTDTKPFAKDIKQLFKNNKQDEPPQVAREVHMIWVFEIARRLVKSENPTDRKKQLDSLPIGSAIAGIIQLLELGDPICSFDDVFDPDGKFHCFSGKDAETRENKISNINKAISEVNSGKELTATDCLKELQECFSAEEMLSEEQLPEVVKAVALVSDDNALVVYESPE